MVRRSTSYTLGGLLLALGAPGGLVVMRLWMSGAAVTTDWLLDELNGDPALYLYLTLSTTLVLSSLGWVLGRYEERLARMSSTDPLTQLLNRRSFEAALNQEVARAQRYRSPLTLVLVDVDHFKQVNDRLGHAAGDAALRCVAQSITSATRTSDVAARLGGDEFAVLLPATNSQHASTLTQRLSRVVASSCAATHDLPVTLSIGVAELGREGATNALELVARADEAMYQAKAAGRNQTAVYKPKRHSGVVAKSGQRPARGAIS